MSRQSSIATSILLVFGVLTAAAPGQERWGPYADLKRAGELIEGGEHAAAEKLLGQLVSEIPQSAQAWYQLALVQSLQGKREQAVKSVSEALTLRAEWPQAHLMAAELLVEDSPEQATAHARRAAEQAKGQHATIRRAIRVGLRAGDTDWVDELLEQAVAATPDDPEVHYLVAEVALRAGDKEKAVEAYRKVTDLAPRDPFAWESLARLHLVLHQPREALGAFQKSLAIHPSNLEVRKKVIELMMRLRVPASELAAQRKYLKYYEWARK